MYLRCLTFIFTFILVSGFVAENDEDLPDLKWPSKYKLKANKLSLTAGWDEDVTYWRTSKKSRADYNKGAVKIVSIPSLKKFPFGVKYEIHPESTEEENNELKCTLIKGTDRDIITLGDILPTTDQFERVGTEILELGEAEKFFCQDMNDNSDVRRTLWASYKNGTWIPVRYEEIEYDVWFGKLSKHIVWNYFNFEKNVEKSVFQIDQYDCEKIEEVHLNDEAVTKHLQFIDPKNKNHVDHIFNVFKQKHSRFYADEKEHEMRKHIFQQNMRLIIENNRKNTGYKLAVNKFADRTPEEMRKHKGLIRKSKRDPGTHPFPYSKSRLEEISKTLPNEFDLRTMGVITPAQDQKSCGSCWAFGTTSAVEGALARTNGGRLLRLSNQALIDCSWGFDNTGCEGGSDTSAYMWMIKHGLPTVEEYGPYENRDGFCNIGNMTTLYPIRGFTNVTPFSVEALKVAIVNHGPLSVSVHATDAFSLYSGGIFYDPECNATELDHEVTLVGYGQRDGEDYWILKNSWGQNWGVDGYIHISVRDNNCGVDTEPTYVVF